MTIKDLAKLIQSQQDTTEEQNPAMIQLLQRVRNKPFYDWFTKDHKQILNPNETIKRNCQCFNCQIGWPVKGSKRYPLFDYELQCYRALTEPTFINSRKATEEDNRWYEEQRKLLEKVPATKSGNIINSHQKLLKERQARLSYPQKRKHLGILKSSGLGISEFTLRLLLYLSLRNDDLKDSQMIIFTGPRLELAVSLISRAKEMLKGNGILFSDKETVLNINNIHLEAFPSHQADSARGLPNVSAIVIDEASFIPDREIDNVMDICIRNIPKSSPYLIALSTPNKPGDFMDKLFKEDYETSIWKRLSLNWTWGIGKIYDQNEIDKIRNNNRSFEREFNLKFAGLEGNVLSSIAIDRCIDTGDTLAKTAPLDDWSIQTKYVMSIDIGWSTSRTAIIVSRFVNGKVQIIHSKEFEERVLFQEVIDEIWRLKSKCSGGLQNILMDASATELYTTLCNEFNQNPSLKYLRDKREWCKKVNSYLENYLFIVPIPFNPENKNMLNHTQRMIQEIDEDGTAIVGIHNSFGDLITSCRSAYAEGDNKLDKTRGVFADSFDSLLMNLSWYRWSK